MFISLIPRLHWTQPENVALTRQNVSHS